MNILNPIYLFWNTKVKGAVAPSQSYDVICEKKWFYLIEMNRIVLRIELVLFESESFTYSVYWFPNLTIHTKCQHYIILSDDIFKIQNNSGAINNIFERFRNIEIKKSQQVGTALLYIRGWGAPRTRLFEAKLMENLVLNFLTLDINTNNFMNFELQNNLQIFMILTNFCQNLNFKC
ncbi:hypothetical protein AGLY_008859 [Aphis glycines]|uniref:Uncharacterized protein n=1 Tax=Aphis glycines TaxID=307491 RepID=A0A6G0TJ27_APHGL|nr:hypothetical protein AGLY_008859 [Aphis glycines]